MLTRTPWFLPVFAVAAAVTIVGCDGGSSPSPPDTYAAPAPVHPAMKDPASASPAARPANPHGATGEPALPPGHPPIAPASDSAEMPVPTASGPADAPAAGGGLVSKLERYGITLKVPAGWKEVASTSSMRIGTFRLEKAQGDAQDAEMSVIPAKGSEQSNIDRWRQQFKENPPATTSTREVSGIRITLTEIEGTYAAGPMAGGTGGAQAGTKLWGAIVTVPGASELIFFKAWGPKATMEKWKASFQEFAGSIQPRK